MKVLVLGGCGIQGRTVVSDLAGSPGVEEVICADIRLDDLSLIADFTEMSKVRPVILDAADHDSLVELLKQCDVCVDMLPLNWLIPVTRAAMEAGVSTVNSNYAYPILEMDEAISRAGICVMPECGLDPGIDLVIYGRAKSCFDTLYKVNSYCGGFPHPDACDKPLNYKVSWNFETVLTSSKRPGTAIRDGQRIEITPEEQHEIDLIHQIDFPGLGRLEAIPNGDAIFFTDLLGATGTIVETGRYALRWPGWCDFWRPLKRLGFLDEEPLPGLPCDISPFSFVASLLGPRMQYAPDQKDLVAMYNVFEGTRDGRQARLTSRLLIERDLETGLMAMSMGVGYPASIAAQMIARGQITGTGVLSPTRDIPYEPFMDHLTRRGIKVEETIEVLS